MQHLGQIEAIKADVIFLLDPRIHRYQIVAIPYLDRMPGVIEDGDVTVAQLASKLANRLKEGFARDIFS